jgi:hypothetical protein
LPPLAFPSLTRVSCTEWMDWDLNHWYRAQESSYIPIVCCFQCFITLQNVSRRKYSPGGLSVRWGEGWGRGEKAKNLDGSMTKKGLGK